ncbi:MAG: PAS domain S-box protein [Bacteroidetes bacterium]|nr:MAG: PAS domain S-box protein [Bacteroidota bacterium]
MKNKFKISDKIKSNKSLNDIGIIILIILIVLLLIYILEDFQLLGDRLKHLSDYKLTVTFVLMFVVSISLVVFSFRRWRETKLEIIERKAADSRMQRSRAQLAAVLDGVPDMIVQVDTNNRILWANKEALSKNPDAIGLSFDTAFSVVGESFMDNYCAWAMESGKIEKGIKYLPAMYGVEGESYWEGIAVPLTGNDGKNFGAIAIARDVSERMRIEHTYNLLASIVESTDFAIYGITYNGTILTWNNGAEKTYGYKASEIVGKSISVLVPLDYRNELMRTIDKVIRKQTVERLESERIRKDGKFIYVSISICPFVDATGMNIGVSAIERDITESKVAQEAIMKSEEKFRTLVTTAPDGIVLTDSNGRIVEVNMAFAQIFGFNRAEMIGEILPKFLTDNESKSRAIEAMRRMRETDKILSGEFEVVARNGSIIPVDVSISPLKDEKMNFSGMIAIMRDVSTRKNYENELRNSREQLRNLAIHLQTAREDEKKRIAFEIHDELGYALTALKLDLAWLSKKMNVKDLNLGKKSKEMSELIETTIKKVRSISTQLRPSILDHFGLEAAIEWQANEFQKRTAIRCKLNLDTSDLVYNDTNSTAIFRIFQETLTNVARHAKATRVDINLYQNENEVVLKVVDNGIGIPKEQLENHKSMGLISIRERASFMGGTVDIHGEEGIGTTVTVKIPVNKMEKMDDKDNNSR